MRLSSVSVCTLTALVAGGLTVQASEAPRNEDSAQEPTTHNRSVASSTVTPKAIAPIAPPEILAEQALAQPAAIDSRHQSRPSSSVAAQNVQAAPVGSVKALTQTAPQTRSVEISEAEALPPNAARAELLTPVAKQPASDKIPHSPSPGVFQSNQNRYNISQVADAKPQAGTTCASQRVEKPQPSTSELAQATTSGGCPRPQPVAPLAVPEPVAEFDSSPALSINIPVGYGADRNTAFISGTYQDSLRKDRGTAGSAGIGIGIGDADKLAGLELSYAFANNNNFGEGGFNAKLHRRFGTDVSAALGWNGFLNIGRNDFEQSKYGVVTKVFRTQDSLDKFFSRVAVTAGIGDGQFRSNGAVRARDNNVNVFGNVAVRLVRPVSFITEWTGQDLALGLSIAPFRNVPVVITPAVRDVTGAGDGARFVLGVGTGFKF